MISPVTCVCVLLAAGSGLYLYQEKHQAQVLDERIDQVMRTVDVTHARTGVLRAEYALLNDPTRLQELARAHLPTLANTQPTQFTNLAELDRRLPAVGEPPAAAPPPLEPAAPLAKLPQPVATPAPAPAPVVAAVRPPPASRPMQMARAAVMASPAAALVASIQAAPLARLAHAAGRSAAARTATARPVQIASRPTYASYHPYAYTTTPASSSEAMTRIAGGGPVDASIPVVASALGMARSMLASGPVGQAYAASDYSGGAQAR